jgi:hypothetical protein
MAKKEVASPSSKKEKQTWSKRITKNKITEEISVTQVENGFLVTHCKYGDKSGSYFNEEKKYISKENPLDEEQEKSFSESIDEILGEIAESEGMINVKD